MTEYGKQYYHRKAQRKNIAGQILVEKLCQTYTDLKTVIDYGCGDGRLTKPFEQKNIEIIGIDNSDAAIKHNVLKKTRQKDLRKPVTLAEQKKPDLAISIEVAEHLEQQYADQLVKNVTTNTDNVLFTAAKPGQPGKGHVNCQPENYWKQKFEQQNLPYNKEKSEHLKKYFRNSKMQNVTPWIPRNIMVFEQQ